MKKKKKIILEKTQAFQKMLLWTI